VGATTWWLVDPREGPYAPCAAGGTRAPPDRATGCRRPPRPGPAAGTCGPDRTRRCTWEAQNPGPGVGVTPWGGPTQAHASQLSGRPSAHLPAQVAQQGWLRAAAWGERAGDARGARSGTPSTRSSGCGNLLARHPSPANRRTAANQVLGGRLCPNLIAKRTPRARPNGSVEADMGSMHAAGWLRQHRLEGQLIAVNGSSLTPGATGPRRGHPLPPTEVSARSRNTPPQRPLFDHPVMMTIRKSHDDIFQLRHHRGLICDEVGIAQEMISCRGARWILLGFAMGCIEWPPSAQTVDL